MADQTNNAILQSLRMMAWERAKGEIESIGHAMYLAAYPTDVRGNRNELHDRFRKFRRLYRKFVKTVEDEGLIEGA